MSNVKRVVPVVADLNLVGCPIKKMNCHAGLILNGLAVTGLHYKDHSCEMTITPYGVHVVLHKTVHRPAAKILVAWANIYFVELLDTSSDEVAA